MKNKLTFLMFLSLALTAAEPVCQINFEGNQNAVNAKNEKIGTGNLKNAEFTEGREGKAVIVPAGGKTLVFPRVSIPQINDGTISLWYKAKEDNKTGFIVEFNDAKWKYRAYLVRSHNNTLDLSFVRPKQIQVYQKNPMKAGIWSHIAITWKQDSGTVCLYVDGKLLGSKSEPGKMEKKDQPEKIYFYLGNGGTYDNVKIFNEALTSEAIKALNETKK